MWEYVRILIVLLSTGLHQSDKVQSFCVLVMRWHYW